VIYLDLDALLHVADRVLPTMLIKDAGLLESALGRPKASAFGADAYPDLHTKAAALVHSLAKNHALVDGNKRLALAGVIAFYGVNGLRLTMTNDEAYDFIISLVVGELDDVPDIAAILEEATQPRT